MQCSGFSSRSKIQEAFGFIPASLCTLFREVSAHLSAKWSRPAIPRHKECQGTRAEELAGCQSPISHKVIALSVEISDNVLSSGR